ncbi:unnamed protein product [Oppiella nova]|uniref:Chitin-binding type-2 domain-containing protein n=1 Tax=Oppiella nova TaxID=334625 RepID=A0A7R9QFG2_9ACAR|nr:unnamed protein product [Oppiella nova]CAG2163946.1 unnamed protein product [Oppiella nova]
MRKYISELPCDGYTYMKDQHNCSRFYRCDISGRSQHLDCYPGLLFNEYINDCDFPYNVAECSQYPFLCQYFSLCWPPVITSHDNSSLHTNATQL